MPPPSPEASGTELCTNWINADTFLEDGLAGTQGGWQQSPDGSAHREWRLRLQGRCHMSAVWPGRVGSSKRKVIAVLEEQQRKSAFIILLFFVFEANCQDGSSCPPSPESDQVSVDAAPKDKKSGLALMLPYLHCDRGRKPRCPRGAAGGKRVAKKILAKSGDAAFQYEIMKDRCLSCQGPACSHELLQHGVWPM